MTEENKEDFELEWVFAEYGAGQAVSEIAKELGKSEDYGHRVQLAEGMEHKETGRDVFVWSLPVEILVSGRYFASSSACTTALLSSIFFAAFIPSNLRCSSSRTVILMTLLPLNSPFSRLSESGSSM